MLPVGCTVTPWLCDRFGTDPKQAHAWTVDTTLCCLAADGQIAELGRHLARVSTAIRNITGCRVA